MKQSFSMSLDQMCNLPLGSNNTSQLTKTNTYCFLAMAVKFNNDREKKALTTLSDSHDLQDDLQDKAVVAIMQARHCRRTMT